MYRAEEHNISEDRTGRGGPPPRMGTCVPRTQPTTMPSPQASILRLAFLSALASTGCLSSDGDGGKTMSQTMFHPSCQEPQTSTAITCDNLCDKVALCTAGLCAEQTGTAELCDGSVAAELKASCLSTCDEDSLQPQADEVQCLLENTCAGVFVQQVCGPENSVECGGLPTPSSGTSAADTGQPATCPYPFDGECDEPEGTGLCPEGSDPVDCSGFGTTGWTTDSWSSTGAWGTSTGSTGGYGSSGSSGSSGSTGGSSTSF